MATGSSSTAPAPITLRRAAPADLPAVTALLNRYYTEWHVWEHDPPARVLHYIEQSPPLGYLLAERDGALVGCVMLRAIPSVPSAAECKRLFVLPEIRGRGLASQLMDHIESLASAHHLAWIYLDSTEEFSAALSFYRIRGYEPCERFNTNSQATLFFRKRLTA
ncbi:MAG TPA: GNAT family N-acetyltransferase [Acidobacteriaceae bacterium]|jgi:GNAT superfamily N-acetyltransferase|nr:GNAT family N-acetyltransferase [Acidobacteriaceae bacterium]